MKAPWLAALLLLCVLPFSLRFAALDHGAGRNYVPDTHIVRSALGMAQDKDLAPPAGKYSNYPYFLPYLLLPVYAGEYVLGKWQGAWDDPKSFAARIAQEPGRVHYPARMLIALFGVASAWVAYRAARAMGMQRGAWIAGFLVATSLLHLHFSVQERPWVPVGFFLLLASWACALYAQAGCWRYLAAACISAGLAFACHQSGLAVFALPGLAWLLGPRGFGPRDWWPRVRDGALALGLGLLVALCVGHAYYLTHGSPQKVILADKLANESGFDVGGIGVIFGVRGESALRMSQALMGYDPLIVILGLVGLCVCWRETRLRAAAIFAVLWALFFLFYESDHVRYLLPLVLMLVFPAAWLVERWLKKPYALVLMALLCALPLVQALRLVHVLRQPDTRALAEAQLAQLPSHSIVAIDRYGPEPDASFRALSRLTTLRNSLVPPEGLRSRESARKLRFERGELAAEVGLDWIGVGELFEIDERARTIAVRPGLDGLGANPAQVLANAGVTHFLHVRRRLSSSDYDAFAKDLSTKTAVWRIDPRTSADGAEALLPTEMEFPLKGLWCVERPGPVLELIALR